VEVFCYALSQSDGSEWRLRIESEAEHFLDVSAWSVTDIARRISADGIHVAVNLNGYTKGARNEIFALCPAPVQTCYMGFPATTGESAHDKHMLCSVAGAASGGCNIGMGICSCTG
jgi:protein O-GlcNAc transferase